jgi:hypothetical protein
VCIKQEALEQSTKQAQRMYDAFDLVVASTKPKQASTARQAD